MNQQGDTPVVKKGESLQEWVSRAVPYLMQVEKLDEKEANRIASQAWDKVNAGNDPQPATQPEPAQQPAPGAPATDPPAPQADAVPAQQKTPAATNDQPKPDWNNSSSWGTPPSESMNGGDGGDTPEDDQGSEPGTEDGGEQSAAGWFADQLEGYANALKEQMVAVGHFDSAQAEAIAQAIEDAMDQLHASLEAMNATEGEAFSFQISVPPPGFFKSQKSANVPPKRMSPRYASKNDGFVYEVADETSPVTGCAVNLYPERETRLSSAELTVAAIDQYITENADVWTENGVMLGGWIDTETGEVGLNATVVVSDTAQANDLCKRYGVDSYLDLAAMKKIKIAQTQATPPAAPTADAQKSAYLSKFFTTKGFQGPYILNLPNRFTALDGDLAIKSLGRNRVGNYLCVWGDPDRRDLSGEWYTPNTADLTTIFDAVGVLPSLYHHAMDKNLKSAVIGLVDRMEKDDVGLWVEAQVREHEMYKRMIMPLINQKKLGWSSGTLPGAREVNKATGEIKRWAIVEATMTPTPMEWRMAVQWQVQNIKSAYQGIGLNLPDLTFNPVARDEEIKSELERIEALVRKF